MNIYSHDTVQWSLSSGQMPAERAPVRIGDCTHVGSQSVIARGVTIGDHVVIGASSFVNRDIPSWTVAVGVPCRPIGRVERRDGRYQLVYDKRGSQPLIVIIDYGLGNPASVRNMLRKAGHTAEVTSERAAIEAATRLILPGVGAFDHGMRNLAERGLIDVLNEAVLVAESADAGHLSRPAVDVARSEEGVLPGLGWLAADTVRFRFPTRTTRCVCRIWAGIP